jgi:hypothetical protein
MRGREWFLGLGMIRGRRRILRMRDLEDSIGGIICIIVGMVLSLTGVGSIIGVPLILYGLFLIYGKEI